MILKGADVLAGQRAFVEIETEMRFTAYRRPEEPVQLDLIATGGERKLDVGGGFRPTNRFRPSAGSSVESDTVTFIESSGLPKTSAFAGRVAERRAVCRVVLAIAGPPSQEPRALHRRDCFTASRKVLFGARLVTSTQVYLQGETSRQSLKLGLYQHYRVSGNCTHEP